jgi:hypothetical protein
MPQVKLVRETHRSCRPGFDEVVDHLVLAALGLDEIGVLSMSAQRSAYLLMRKKVRLLRAS